MAFESADPEALGLGLPAGAAHYRAFVGPPQAFDLVAAMQFNLLTLLGLREQHYLLDIGCGSLRGGRLFIPYLLPGHYYGLEPEAWLVQEGIDKLIGRDQVALKQPVFSHNADFQLSAFGRSFDFLLAQSIFSHAAPGQVQRCLTEARRVMTMHSLFAATFVEGAENYQGEAWVYPSCITYTYEYLSGLAEQAGLCCLRLPWPHPFGQSWVVFFDAAARERLAGLQAVSQYTLLHDALEPGAGGGERAATLEELAARYRALEQEHARLERAYADLERWTRELTDIIAARDREREAVARWLPAPLRRALFHSGR